jgi:hypothetical protein
MTFHSLDTSQPKQEYYSIRLGSNVFSVSSQGVFIAIVVIAIVLRLASAIYQGNSVADLPGIYDQISYDGLARRVVDGYGFSFAEGHWPATRAGEPTAHWSYLYTLYLAVVYKIFGPNPIVARVIQALIAGVFHPWLTFRIGRRVIGTQVGLLSAFLSAIYIYFFYYAGGLVTETFFITGILWTFNTIFRLFDKYQQQNTSIEGNNLRILWFEFGLALGVTTLLRQTFLLFLPILFLWLWWYIPGYTKKSVLSLLSVRFANWSVIKGMVLSILVVVLMVLPWTVRNYRAFDTFVLLNTNAGFAFFWGNHPSHGSQFVPILPSSSYYDLIPTDLLILNEGKLDRALMQEGFEFVFDDPVRYVLLSLSRFEEYFKFWPTDDSGLISNISRVGSFGILLPFMVFGLWVLIKHTDRIILLNRSLVILIYLFVILYTLLHLLTWTLIRYRLPVDAFLVIFAALGMHQIIKLVDKLPLRNFGKI